jgi:hypothetical protein
MCCSDGSPRTGRAARNGPWGRLLRMRCRRRMQVGQLAPESGQSALIPREPGRAQRASRLGRPSLTLRKWLSRASRHPGQLIPSGMASWIRVVSARGFRVRCEQGDLGQDPGELGDSRGETLAWRRREQPRRRRNVKKSSPRGTSADANVATSTGALGVPAAGRSPGRAAVSIKRVESSMRSCAYPSRMCPAAIRDERALVGLGAPSARTRSR